MAPGENEFDTPDLNEQVSAEKEYKSLFLLHQRVGRGGRSAEAGRLGIVPFPFKQDQHFETKGKKKKEICVPDSWQPDSIYNLLQQICAENICPKPALGRD